MDNRPIGVFDSGLGGLTGVRELRKRLPNENIVYFGDTGRVPYGSRSPETILQYARQDIAFLLSKDVKCIMAACGTVSSIYPAAEAAKLPVPYLGVVDAAARAGRFRHPEPPHRRHRHGGHHPLPQLRDCPAQARSRRGDHGPALPPLRASRGGRLCGPQRPRQAAGDPSGHRPVSGRGAGGRGWTPSSSAAPTTPSSKR